MKSIFIMMGALLFLVTSMAMAVEDQNETQRIKKIEDRLPKLNETKLKALMERVGKPVPDKFFQCLCGPGMTGGGVSYKPGSPCRATGVLGGSWDQGFDSKAYKGCIKHAKYDDGQTIVDVISSAVSKKKVTKIDRKDIILRLEEKNKKYYNLCLPILSAKNFKDMERESKFSTLDKVIGIIKQTDNICEESVALNLFFNEQQSNSSFSTMYDIVVTWLPMTNAYDYAAFIGLPFASSFGNLVNADATVKIINNINKFKEIDIVFQGAHELFQTSKNWNEKEINNQIDNLKKKINSVDNVMKAIEMSYQKNYHETRDEIYNREGKEEEGNAQWVSFNKKDKILRQKADERKKSLWLERTNFLLKSKVLTEYRLPLSQKSCAELLADRESECKKQKQKQAKVVLEQAKKIPVREIPKDINPYHGVTDSSIKIMK